MEFARQITRLFEWEHHVEEIDETRFDEYAQLAAYWEYGNIGFTSMIVWGELPHIRSLAPEMVAGYVGSSVMGGAHILDVFEGQHVPRFEILLRKVTAWGLPSSTLKQLVRDHYAGDLVDEAIECLRESYESGGDLESQRAWLFDLHHRQRSFIGGTAWRHAFASWPVIPMLTRELLEVSGGLPPGTLAERRAQDELLARRFPAASGVPIDQLVRTLLMGRHSAELRRQYPQIRGPQRVQRLTDLNSAGWRRVRHLAEKGRAAASQVLDGDLLRQIVPLPNEPVPGDVLSWSGRKTLLEFMLWCASR